MARNTRTQGREHRRNIEARRYRAREKEGGRRAHKHGTAPPKNTKTPYFYRAYTADESRVNHARITCEVNIQSLAHESREYVNHNPTDNTAVLYTHTHGPNEPLLK
jgi:hypothetical protein